jgi:hypothetical protein
VLPFFIVQVPRFNVERFRGYWLLAAGRMPEGRTESQKLKLEDSDPESNRKGKQNLLPFYYFIYKFLIGNAHFFR